MSVSELFSILNAAPAGRSIRVNGSCPYYFPYVLPGGSSYRIVCSKDGYAPVGGQITVNSPTQDVGTFNLPEITEADDSLGNWTTSAWNRVDEVPGTYWTDGYKTTTAFGVFDFAGSIFYSTDGTAADFFQRFPESQRSQLVLRQYQQ